MRSASASNSTSMAAGFRSFGSPIPYLFGGLALMLALIAVALLMLACSYRKNPSSTSAGNEEKAAKKVEDSEPKIVVIMAGDTNPTYLANPVSSQAIPLHEEEI